MPSDKQLEAIRKEDRLIAAVNVHRSVLNLPVSALESRLYLDTRIWILDLSERGFPPRKWMEMWPGSHHFLIMFSAEINDRHR